MLDDFHPSDANRGGPIWTLHSDPGAVVTDPSLTREQKRAILASWASDARAVTNAPALRRLDNGVVLNIDSILDALKSLDGVSEPPRPARNRSPAASPRRAWLARTLQRMPASRRSDDDDDDPPPCPAAAARPRPIPSLDSAALAAA